MSARDDYTAAETRLVEVERQIEAWREWGRPVEYSWPQRAKPRPEGDLAELLLERERLQEESFKAWRRMRGVE